jgi:two-component system KDP operon response regulator KdpE
LRHGLQAAGEAPVFRSGPLTVDLVSRHVLLHGSDVHLSPKEYGLLRFLVGQAGRVVTHHQILEEVWGPANVEDVQYLRVLMRALRKKIEPESETQVPQLIVTESGVGYRLMLLPPEAPTSADSG